MATIQNKAIRVNSLAKKLRDNNAEGLIPVLGYVVHIDKGLVEISSSLSGSTIITIQEKDIIHFVDTDDESKPATFYIRSDAKLCIQYHIQAADMAIGNDSYSGSQNKCSCSDHPLDTEGASSSDTVFRQQQQSGGISRQDARCRASHLGCKIGCYFLHPDDAFARYLCLSSCGNEFTRCTFRL